MFWNADILEFLLMGFILGWLFRSAFFIRSATKQDAPTFRQVIGLPESTVAAGEVEPPPAWRDHPRWGELEAEAFSWDWTHGKVHVTDDWSQTSDELDVGQFADECGMTVAELRSRVG